MYVSDDAPLYIYYDLSPLLLQLPLLEELHLDGDIAYYPEKMADNPGKMKFMNPAYMLPLFLLQKHANKNREIDFSEIPYPEIVALSYAGCRMGGEGEELNLIMGSKYSDNLWQFEEHPDSLPFWFPGCKSKHKPRTKYLPKNGFYSTHYSNGNTIIAGNMVDGKPDGEWKWWYADGVPCEKREYKNGVEDGPWIFFNQKGDTSLVLFFKDEKIIREVRMSYDSSSHSNGKMTAMHERRFDCYFDQRVVTITDIDYISNDALDTLTHYVIHCPNKNGLTYEIRKDYYKNELVSYYRYCYRSYPTYQERQYLNASGSVVTERWIYVRDSVFDTAWFANGRVRFIRVEGPAGYFGKYTVSKYDSAGYLESVFASIRYDTLQGKNNYFYKNGKIKMSSNYTKGKLNGPTTLFDENGKEIEVKQYENGILLEK